MSEREILVHPDQRLLEPALEIDRYGGELRDLATEMRIKIAGTGVGLAAPQLGVAQRLIVIDTPRLQLALANPVIIGHQSGVVLSTEGCLSCPGVEQTMSRWPVIMVHARDLSGSLVVLRLGGLEAIVAQHEIDHLDGRLIVTPRDAAPAA